MTTIDFDRVQFRLVGTRTGALEIPLPGSRRIIPFLLVCGFLYVAQIFGGGMAMTWLFEALDQDGFDPFGSVQLIWLLCLAHPLAFFGAAYLFGTESSVTPFLESRTVEIELHGTEVRADGVSIPRHTLVVAPHQLRVPGLTLDFDPPLGPEILGPLSEALEQRDRLAAARTGGSVPPELSRLRER